MAIANAPVKVEINGVEIATTPFQLLQWKYGLRLEKGGMKLKGGRKVSAHIKRLTRMKRNTPIEEIEAEVNRVLAELGQ